MKIILKILICVLMFTAFIRFGYGIATGGVLNVDPYNPMFGYFLDIMALTLFGLHFNESLSSVKYHYYKRSKLHLKRAVNK